MHHFILWMSAASARRQRRGTDLFTPRSMLRRCDSWLFQLSENQAPTRTLPTRGSRIRRSFWWASGGVQDALATFYGTVVYDRTDERAPRIWVADGLTFRPASPDVSKYKMASSCRYLFCSRIILLHWDVSFPLDGRPPRLGQRYRLTKLLLGRAHWSILVFTYAVCRRLGELCSCCVSNGIVWYLRVYSVFCR